MVLTFAIDIKSGMSWIPSILVVLTALVATINYVTGAIQLTADQAAGLALVVTILTAVATFLKSVEND